MRASQFELAAEATDSITGVSVPYVAEDTSDAPDWAFLEKAEEMLSFALLEILSWRGVWVGMIAEEAASMNSEYRA
jgi:hypothetical protein